MATSQTQGVWYPDESLEEKFNTGGMDSIKNHLMTYIKEHLEEYKAIAKVESFEECIEKISYELERKGSLHLPSEMADQIREINKEIWYRGEEGNENRQNIKEDWTQKYSMKWRQARKIEIQFVLKKCKEEIRALLAS